MNATDTMVNKPVNYHYYRPQRSWGKVMFSQACVILFTGGGGGSWGEGVCLSACWDTIPPEQTPPEQTPPHRACWEIRSTHGRYASYWNAIYVLEKLTQTENILVTGAFTECSFEEKEVHSE